MDNVSVAYLLSNWIAPSVGLWYLVSDLQDLGHLQIRSSNGWLLHHWTSELALVICCVIRLPSWRIAVIMALCCAVLRLLWPDEAIIAMCCAVVYQVFVRAGLFGNDILGNARSYVKYSIVARSLWDFGVYVQEHQGIISGEVDLNSASVSLLLVVCDLALNRTWLDWALILPMHFIRYKSWPYEWFIVVISLRIYKRMFKGSLTIVDSVTSIFSHGITHLAIWLAFRAARWSIQGDETDAQIASTLWTAYFGTFAVFFASVFPFIILCQGVTSIFSEGKLNYKLERRAKLFGSVAATSRHAEPFKDRASAINATWYEVYMPSISRDTVHQIRLLRFVSLDPIIECKVTTFDLRYAPKYAALTYTCGNPLSTEDDLEETLHYIQCNGQPFCTRPNLYAALSTLRNSNEVFWLWVDSFCINQNDSDERLDQVARMGHIYSHAERVLVWTGKLTQDVALAVQFSQIVDSDRSSHWLDNDHTELSLAYSFFESCLDSLRISLSLFPGDKSTSADDDQHIRKQLETSIKSFSSRRWLQRAWILQEIALARSIKVYCGNATLTWKAVEFMLSFGLSVQQYSPQAFRRTLRSLREHILPSEVDIKPPHIQRIWTSWGGAFDAKSLRGTYLLYLLSETRMFKCSDPRDKVFCVLGMVNIDTPATADEEKLQLVYDTKVEDVFYWTAHCCVLACPSLMCLSLVDTRAPSTLNLPSWVPNFDAGTHMKPLLFNDHIGLGIHRESFNATNKQIEGPVLLVCGKVIGTVAAVHDFQLIDLLSASTANLESVFNFCYESTSGYFNGDNYLEVLWRTLTCSSGCKFSKEKIGLEDFSI